MPIGEMISTWGRVRWRWPLNVYKLNLVEVTLSFSFVINFCLIPSKESQGSHFRYGGLKAKANLLVGNGENLILKWSAKRYLLGVKGGNFVEEILSKVLSLKVLAKDHKQFESIFGKPEFLEYAYLWFSSIYSAQHQKQISVEEVRCQDSFDQLDVCNSLATIERMP